MTTPTHTMEFTSVYRDATEAITQGPQNYGIGTTLSPEIIIYISVGIFGVLGNGFAAFVIATNRRMRQKVCNIFILNQSIIDLGGSFFLIVNNPAIVSQRVPANKAWGEFYCRVWGSSYPMWAMFEMSTANLVAITVERYAEIVHPLSYPVVFSRRRAYVAIGCVWAFGVIFPTFPNVWPSPPGPQGFCLRYSGWPNLALARFVGITFYFLIMVAPIVLMIYCYSRMFITIRTKVSPAAAHGLSLAEKAREVRRATARKNLVKTLVTVCIAFFLCWVLNQTYFIINVGRAVSFTSTFYYITVHLVFINCAINPIIYTAQYREFQDAVKAKFPCLRRAGNVGDQFTQQTAS